MMNKWTNEWTNEWPKRTNERRSVCGVWEHERRRRRLFDCSAGETHSGLRLVAQLTEVVRLVQTFLPALRPQLQVVVTAILLPAVVVRLVGQVAHADLHLQHAQVAPHLVVLATQTLCLITNVTHFYLRLCGVLGRHPYMHTSMRWPNRFL